MFRLKSFYRNKLFMIAFKLNISSTTRILPEDQSISTPLVIVTFFYLPFSVYNLYHLQASRTYPNIMGMPMAHQNNRIDTE